MRWKMLLWLRRGKEEGRQLERRWLIAMGLVLLLLPGQALFVEPRKIVVTSIRPALDEALKSLATVLETVGLRGDSTTLGQVGAAASEVAQVVVRGRVLLVNLGEWSHRAQGEHVRVEGVGLTKAIGGHHLWHHAHKGCLAVDAVAFGAALFSSTRSCGSRLLLAGWKHHVFLLLINDYVICYVLDEGAIAWEWLQALFNLWHHRE